MREELQGLIELDTFDDVSFYKGKPTGSRWVFDLKENLDGSIERFKARLVAKGFTQIYGTNYNETYAPVAKMESVKILLSIVALNNLELCQADVKQAFLRP